MPTTGRRDGRVTWVTVVVVLAVAALAVGLILPEIQKVREVAYRSRCQGKSKQLWLAVRNYEDTYGSLPRGTVPNTEFPPDRR